MPLGDLASERVYFSVTPFNVLNGSDAAYMLSDLIYKLGREVASREGIPIWDTLEITTTINEIDTRTLDRLVQEVSEIKTVTASVIAVKER